ncbi:MAG: hypothetical protein ABR534_12375, partial [Desulfotignum sp.]
AKNFIRVAPVVDPAGYPEMVKKLTAGQGALTLADRFALACRAFDHTAAYDRAIADYLAGRSDTQLQSCYTPGE